MIIELEKTFSRCKMQGLRDDGNREEDWPSESNARLTTPFFKCPPPGFKGLTPRHFLRHKMHCISGGVPVLRHSLKPGGPLVLFKMYVIGCLMHHVTVIRIGLEYSFYFDVLFWRFRYPKRQFWCVMTSER